MFSVRRLPLAKKLIVLSTTTSLVALVIASSAWVIDAWINGKQSLQQETAILAQLMADRSNAALAFGDTSLANQNLGTVGSLPNILAACIYDQDNQLFAAYEKTARGNTGCPGSSLDNPAGGNAIEVYTPISLEDRTIGTLFIRSDLSRLFRQARQNIFSAVLILLLAGLIAYIISSRFQKIISGPINQLSRVARAVAGEHNYKVRAHKQSDDELGALVDAFNDMLDTIEVQNRFLTNSRDQLEELVGKRTGELQASNRELEAFCYSVSHDLRAPLRSINGFSQALLEDYSDLLDKEGRNYLERVMRSATRMGQLIDDLLSLSRVSRSQLTPEQIDLSTLAEDVVEEITAGSDYQAAVDIQPGISAFGDPTLMRVVLDNLLGNAFKYSAKTQHPRISFGQSRQTGQPVYWVRDNGAGFDMQYAGKLFGTFQRLHRNEDFEGTGVGLASVARVVHRHGGKIWAESAIDHGASFYFTLDPANIDTGSADSADT